MTIHLKDNAIGVDAKINKYINRLNKRLNEDLGWDVDIYGKLYREHDGSKYYPHAFVGDKDYQEVFVNDKVNGEVGFYLGKTREVNKNIIVDCDVIFSLDLDKIDNGSLQREDERATTLALYAVELCEDVTLIKTDFREVYADFDTSNIARGSMQPFLNVSFSIEINYSKNYCYGM
jgi:hypothetical protein